MAILPFGVPPSPFKRSSSTLIVPSLTSYNILRGNAGGLTLQGGSGSGDDLTLESTSHATKGFIYLGSDNLNIWDDVNKRLGFGLTNPSATVHIDKTLEITSGNGDSLKSVVRASPLTSSSAAFRGALIQAFTITGDTVAITGSVIAESAVANHIGDFNVTDFYGLQLQAFIGPVLSAPAGTPTATRMYASVFQGNLKTTSTGTNATDAVGGYFDMRHSSPGTVTRMAGAHVAVGVLDGGSGGGTVSTLYGLKVSRRNPATTNLLSAGTITNGYMLYLDGWPTTGVTYSNTPIQLNLEDNDVTTIAIRQQDVDATNQIGGATMIGAVANPSAELHVQTATITNEVFRIESVATNDDPARKFFQARAATTDATVTTLATIAIPATTTVLIEAFITARRTGGAAGTAEDGAGYRVLLCVKNVAGTATVIGAVNQLFVAEDQAGWDATIDVNAGNARIRITGAVNNNITWHTTYSILPVGS